MATNKTLFDAVDAELRNARAALNNAGAYMDMIKDAVMEIENPSVIEESLSLKGEDHLIK
jgi:hypothetical protein